MKKSSKHSNLSLVLYVVSIIIAAYSIFTIYSSYNYISTLAETGSIVIKNQMADVISYYVSASMPYVFYAIAIWAIGYIIDKINVLNNILTLKSDNKDEE